MSSEVSATNQDKILILDENGEQAEASARALVDSVPNAAVTAVASIGGYRDAFSSSDFDVVIVDYDIPEVRSLEFIAQLRLRDHEPDVLLVSRCDEPAVVRLIAESRRRYVVRDDNLQDSLIHSVRDILRIRRLEREMATIRAKLTEANSMLEEKNRRLDEFCTTIAHDIRGPLAGLVLKIEYILDGYEEALGGRCSQLMRRSLDSTQRLIGVVQAMYEFAKVGAKAATMEQLDLRKLVYEVLGDLNVGEGKDIQVGVDNLPSICGNAALLRRVFLNLISNAVKYNDKPQIRINIGSSGVVERSIGRFANIFIEDNGPGIPADEAKHMFKMFTRGKVGTDKSKDGLGIGLAVVQRIVELHYGRIQLGVSSGTGCRFEFTLPLEKIELVY